MNSTYLKSALLAGLLELEQSGDIVITNPVPQALADQLFAKLIDRWGRQSLDVQRLLQLGADPKCSGWMGLTALDLAKDRIDEEGRMILELLQKKCLDE